MTWTGQTKKRPGVGMLGKESLGFLLQHTCQIMPTTASTLVTLSTTASPWTTRRMHSRPFTKKTSRRQRVLGGSAFQTMAVHWKFSWMRNTPRRWVRRDEEGVFLFLARWSTSSMWSKIRGKMNGQHRPIPIFDLTGPVHTFLTSHVLNLDRVGHSSRDGGRPFRPTDLPARRLRCRRWSSSPGRRGAMLLRSAWKRSCWSFGHQVGCGGRTRVEDGKRGPAEKGGWRLCGRTMFSHREPVWRRGLGERETLVVICLGGSGGWANWSGSLWSFLYVSSRFHRSNWAQRLDHGVSRCFQSSWFAHDLPPQIW